jgi:hypothetical protein
VAVGVVARLLLVVQVDLVVVAEDLVQMEQEQQEQLILVVVGVQLVQP